MKIFFYFILTLFLITNIFFSKSSLSQSVPGIVHGEFMIVNQTDWFDSTSADGQPLLIKIYPIGGIFSGDNKYTSRAFYTLGFNNPPLETDAFIAGFSKIVPPTNITNQYRHYIIGNFDGSGNINECSFAYGMAKYKIEFWSVTTENGQDSLINSLINSLIMDWGNANMTGNYPYYADLVIEFFSASYITFNFLNDSQRHNIDTVSKHIKHWQQFGNSYQDTNRLPSKGNFPSDNTENGEYLNWPIDANLYNGSIGQENAGDLYMNLEIQTNHYARINRGIPFSINDSAKLSLKHSDTYANNARLYVQNNSVFTVRESAALEINKYGNVIIEDGGKMYMEDNSNIYFADHGEIIINAGGTLYNCGANFTNNNYSCILVNDSGKYFEGAPECYFTTHYVNDGAFVVINGGDLIIGDSSKIIFDGANSFLKINPQSKIFLGENASIEFKNGAYISANGCTFNSIDSLKKWKGIVLENSGIDSIVNCTFSNAKTAITVKNTSGSFENRVIKNNTFNIPAGGDHKGIYGENNYNILIQDNTFSMPVNPQNINFYYSGIFLKNSSPNGEPESAGQTEEETMPFPYSLNIINNNFKNGSGSIILANYLSNVLPYYIKGNSFDSASSLGILGLKITGTIKDNVSADFVTPLGIHLVNSSPNLYNNTIISRDVSLHLIGNSYPNLSPYIYGNQLTWTGGKNRFTTQNFDNIQLTHPANVYTDFGENRFTIFDTASAYHIYGWLDSTISKYGGRNNCWYPGNTAKIYLRHTNSGNPVNTVTGVTTIDCDHEIDPNGWSVDYLGNGIYDSTKQSVNNTGNVPMEEDLIYEQAYNYYNNSLYLDAISSFKDLINTYNEYENLPKSTLDLYTCYEYLDTSLTQSERNTLFGNLKVFAEEKISSGNYKNEEFLDNCFDIITMCEAKLENYDAASNNYEFIALYHPDPDIRLNASWNYTEVQALLNSGNGGGEQFQITNDKLQVEELIELKEIQRLNEIISNDPVMCKLKKSYEKNTSERKDKNAKQIQLKNEGKSSEKIKDYIRKSNELDYSKEIKAKRNLFELRNLSDENLEKRRIEDMMLSTRSIHNEFESDYVVILADEYKLSQNYPIRRGGRLIRQLI